MLTHQKINDFNEYSHLVTRELNNEVVNISLVIYFGNRAMSSLHDLVWLDIVSGKMLDIANLNDKYPFEIILKNNVQKNEPQN